MPLPLPALEVDKPLPLTNGEPVAAQSVKEPIKEKEKAKIKEIRFDSKACLPLGSPIEIVVEGEVQLKPFLKAVQGFERKRKYHKSQKPRLPHSLSISV